MLKLDLCEHLPIPVLERAAVSEVEFADRVFEQPVEKLRWLLPQVFEVSLSFYELLQVGEAIENLDGHDLQDIPSHFLRVECLVFSA